MSIVLDRNRSYGIVYGDEVERFYQDGCFFNGTGKFVRAADGQQPSTPDPEPVQVVEQLSDKATRIFRLQGLSMKGLRELAGKIEKATEVAAPPGGKGAKARLVKYIADHTTD